MASQTQSPRYYGQVKEKRTLMSFEGYYQILCARGHEGAEDQYTDPLPEICDEDNCSAKIVWWNLVDQTNGSLDENCTRIDGYVELEIAIPAVPCTCKCGHLHYLSNNTFKIPPEGIGHHVK
jgi:hypothetical protein